MQSYEKKICSSVCACMCLHAEFTGKDQSSMSLMKLESLGVFTTCALIYLSVSASILN